MLQNLQSKTGSDVFDAVDIAASFFKGGSGDLRNIDDRPFANRDDKAFGQVGGHVHHSAFQLCFAQVGTGDDGVLGTAQIVERSNILDKTSHNKFDIYLIAV